MVPNRRCAARHKTVIEKEINSSTISRIKYAVLPLDLDRKKNRGFIRETFLRTVRTKLCVSTVLTKTGKNTGHTFLYIIIFFEYIDFFFTSFITLPKTLRINVGGKSGRTSGEERHATRKSIQRKSFPFRPARNGGHWNVVLPVHAVASREASKIPGIKLGLKPGKCEFEMLPPDVRGPDLPSA